MPRHYKRKIGSRRYIDYSEEKLQECLRSIWSKQLTQRAAAKEYNIPRSTIKLKLKNSHSNKPGHPKVFTDEEENSFVAHITALSEFGFPLTDIDLQFIVRDYLAAQGREVKQFKNNTPGREWIKLFLTRHQSLSKRFANNIKKVRAQVNQEDIKTFIENINTELQSVPPENIYNYDETNLTDDPGRKKVICRRGSKYPERVVNATKVNFTVMFCGNAAGVAVPPYVIYKADHLWSTWADNGPEGTRYNRTKSGWIDSLTFEDWFVYHLLPILKKQNGRKVVIGDNLSSHINKRVLQECEKNNIKFICLPPNATHILQPLDVAYFRPLKIKWREVLMAWKDSQYGRKLPTTPKEVFPTLLKQALDKLTDTPSNLVSGFRRTGIFPPNSDEPLKRLPMQDRILNLNLIGDVFMEKLKQMRNGDESTPVTARKKKKLDVPAGRSICAKDILEAGPSGCQTKPTKVAKKVKTKKTPKKHYIFQDSTTDCDSEISLASSTEDLITAHAIDDSDEESIPLAKIKDDQQFFQDEDRSENEEIIEKKLVDSSTRTNISNPDGNEDKSFSELPLANQSKSAHQLDESDEESILLAKIKDDKQNFQDEDRSENEEIIEKKLVDSSTRTNISNPDGNEDKSFSELPLANQSKSAHQLDEPDEESELAKVKGDQKNFHDGDKPESEEKTEEKIADCSTLTNISNPDGNEDNLFSNLPLLKQSKSADYAVGDYVIVSWNSEVYPGQIVSESEEGVMVSCMKRGKLYWRWPVIKDEQLYRWQDVLKKIDVPKFIKKGCFTICELDSTSNNETTKNVLQGDATLQLQPDLQSRIVSLVDKTKGASLLNFVADSTLNIAKPDSKKCENGDPGRGGAFVEHLDYDKYSIGDHVIVKWNCLLYPGQITAKSDKGLVVLCMKKGKTFWRWPVIKDEQFYSWENIVKKIEVPKLIKKGCFTVYEMDKSS